jgi:hypothetical protein
MPYTTRADGDVITASSHNANCRDQVVSTVTSGTRPSGTEGQIIYETDTDLYRAYLGGWIDWGSLGAWQTYTPTLTQSGIVTKTVTYARYNKIGRQVTLAIRLDFTGAGTGNNAILVGLPLTAAVAGDVPLGQGIFYDSAPTPQIYVAAAVLNSTTTIGFYDATTPTGVVKLGQTGTSFNGAVASGDAILINGTYESAA